MVSIWYPFTFGRLEDDTGDQVRDSPLLVGRIAKTVLWSLLKAYQPFIPDQLTLPVGHRGPNPLDGTDECVASENPRNHPPLCLCRPPFFRSQDPQRRCHALPVCLTARLRSRIG